MIDRRVFGRPHDIDKFLNRVLDPQQQRGQKSNQSERPVEDGKVIDLPVAEESLDAPDQAALHALVINQAAIDLSGLRLGRIAGFILLAVCGAGLTQQFGRQLDQPANIAFDVLINGLLAGGGGVLSIDVRRRRNRVAVEFQRNRRQGLAIEYGCSTVARTKVDAHTE
jgi:hypothetical protein